MLEVVGLSYIKKNEIVEIDEYVPLSVEFLENRREGFNVLFWRAEKENCFLFELGISEFDGSIVRFVLISLSQKEVQLVDHVEFAPTIELGIPLFKTDGIFDKNGLCDNKIDIVVKIGERGIYIFFNQAPLTSSFQNGQILFGLTKQKFLAAVGVTQIEEELYKKLISTFSK